MSPVAVLLRGVNVGGRARLPMADLRALLGAAGFGGVRTYLASGNVVLDPGERTPVEAADRVRELVAEQLGLDVACLVREPAELHAVLDADPLAAVAVDPARHVVVFLADEPDPGLLADLAPADFLPERFAVQGRLVHAWYPEGTRQARLTHAFWERRLRTIATARNWSTVLRLRDMLTGD